MNDNDKLKLRQLDETAEKIYRYIVNTLQIGKARTISNGDAFMSVHVDRLHQHLYAIAHYFEQNGDMCCDPDMTFYAPKEGVYVVSFQQAIPPVWTHIDTCTPQQIADMRDFANQWMRNIQEQQELEVC